MSRFALRITNSSKENLELHLEPWGEQFEMPGGAAFKVEASGPDDDILEIECVEGKLVVYGWPGSMVTISTVK